jgi:hypothetical protein
MASKVVKLKNYDTYTINSSYLSKRHGFKRCVSFWFHGFDDASLFPLFTLHITDPEFLTNKKIRQEINREIVDYLLENEKHEQ